MALNPFGPRVEKILGEPPKEVTPGQAVSLWVHDNPQLQEDFHETASRRITEYIRVSLARYNIWGVTVEWVEAPLLYEVRARRYKDKVNRELTVARARIYTEQVNELSSDVDSWMALMDWVCACLLSDFGIVTTGEVAAATGRLNAVAQKAENKRLEKEEQAAIESIKRSAAS
jgi:hypothetical protein